jgi:hypothetical protein
MRAISPLDYLPLWGVFVATVVLVLLSVGAGFLLGARNRRQSAEAQKTPVGEIVAAMLGLLALLLAFTFSLAATRFETRRGLVLDEANAIGTTWLRAGLLGDSHCGDVRKLLSEYVEVRLAAVQTGKVVEGVAQSEELQKRLWAQATAAGREQAGSITTGLFITSLNEVIDLHAKRVMHGLRTRIPPVIWGALYLVAFLSLGAMGYHAGLIGVRRFMFIVPPVLTFSLVLLLIADLDRPQEGMFKVSQQALVDLRGLMNGQ